MCVIVLKSFIINVFEDFCPSRPTRLTAKTYFFIYTLHAQDTIFTFVFSKMHFQMSIESGVLILQDFCHPVIWSNTSNHTGKRENTGRLRGLNPNFPGLPNNLNQSLDPAFLMPDCFQSLLVLDQALGIIPPCSW